jgi:hypothetical protein
METPKTPSNLEPNAVESLPDKPVTDSDADAVRAGPFAESWGETTTSRIWKSNASGRAPTQIAW